MPLPLGQIGKDALAAGDDAAGGKIGPRNHRGDLVDGDVGPVDDGADRGDQFVQIMRRDVGRHADRDAGGSVHQQAGQGRGEDGGFGRFLVVVGGEIDGLLVEVPGQFLGGLGEPALRVTVGRGRVAVDRAEIALGIDERVADDPRLGEADQRVIDRGVAVRVVVAEHLADDLGAFVVRAVVQQAQAEHRVKDAALHGLEAVARVRQGARDDHRHRVIDVGGLHDLGDVGRRKLFVGGVHCGKVAGSRWWAVSGAQAENQ